MLHGLQDRRVLNHRGDQMLSPALCRQGTADDRKVIGLSPAGSKIQVLVPDLEDSRQSLFGLRDTPFGCHTSVMHAGRIPVILQKNFVHQRGDFGKAPCRRGIIKIDVSFFVHINLCYFTCGSSQYLFCHH